VLLSDIGLRVVAVSRVFKINRYNANCLYLSHSNYFFPIIIYLRMFVFILPVLIRETDVMFESHLYGLVL
jgi:hypothetical protein